MRSLRLILRYSLAPRHSPHTDVTAQVQLITTILIYFLSQDVLLRAESAGVWRIVAVSCDAIGARSLLEMAARHPHFVAPCVGLHPAVRAVDGRVTFEPSLRFWFLIGIAFRGVHARWLQNFARLANADAAAAQVELDATVALIGECHTRLAAVGEVHPLVFMISFACRRMF